VHQSVASHRPPSIVMAVQRADDEQPVLRLMPPPAGSPTEPRCYGSPAKPTMKREVTRVGRVSSYDQLMKASDEESKRDESDEAEADGEDGEDGMVVRTNKKSSFMTDEVEEKLQLGGADPYGLLELQDKRWRASADDIRKSYRRLVLKHHPDKKASAVAEAQAAKLEREAKEKKKERESKERKSNGEVVEEEEEDSEEDSEFKLLSAAWDLLGNVERRRAFDSVDYINDDLPSGFRKGKNFYRTFAAPFLRQAKFSELPKVPQLGDEETPYEEVATFYRFWQNLRSWRAFDLLTEHDQAAAEDREERRWMQRQNKNVTDRIKREELKRVQAFVQLAYENDPRVALNREKLTAAKVAAKAAKEDALSQEKAVREAAVQAAGEVERQKQAVADVAKQAQSENKAADKREKERLRSLLKKARKELKTLAEAGRWASRAADIEVLAATLSVEQLQALHAALVAATDAETVAAMEAKLSADVAQLVAQ